MKKSLAAALSLCMMLGTLTPALADDDALEKVVDGSLMVTRLGGVGAGMVIGPPVATLRETVKAYKEMTPGLADKVGGSDNGPVMLVSSVFTIPASMILGTLKGIYYGGKNGMIEGFNAPFGPASFSLDDDIED